MQEENAKSSKNFCAPHAGGQRAFSGTLKIVFRIVPFMLDRMPVERVLLNRIFVGG
jgi:hypothetical protein